MRVLLFSTFMQTKDMASIVLPLIWVDGKWHDRVCHHHSKIAVVGSCQGIAKAALTSVMIGQGVALGRAFGAASHVELMNIFIFYYLPAAEERAKK